MSDTTKTGTCERHDGCLVLWEKDKAGGCPLCTAGRRFTEYVASVQAVMDPVHDLAEKIKTLGTGVPVHKPVKAPRKKRATKKNGRPRKGQVWAVKKKIADYEVAAGRRDHKPSPVKVLRCSRRGSDGLFVEIQTTKPRGREKLNPRWVTLTSFRNRYERKG